MPTVVSYARISKEEVGNKDNVEIQTAECRDYASERGWTVLHAFADNNITISQRSIKPREGFDKLFAAVQAGHINVVVITEPERLYRRPRELEDLIDVAEAGRPVKIVTTDGREFDLSTTNGKHDLRSHINNAAREADKISDRSKRKKLAHAREGRPSGGTRPFGYAPDLVTPLEPGGQLTWTVRRTTPEGEVEEVEVTFLPEAALVREAAERVLSGESLRSIANDWNHRGISTPTGGRWAPHVLKRLLLSPRIAGLREHLGHVLGLAKWRKILDPEQAELVRRILTDPSRTKVRFTGRSYQLTGLLFCGSCGVQLYGGLHTLRNGRKIRMYTCKRGPGFFGCGRVHQIGDPLDEVVSEAVLLRLDSPETHAVLRARAENDQEAGLFERLQADRTRLKQLADYLVDGTLEKPEYLIQKARLKERIEVTERALDRVASKRTLVSIPPAGQVRPMWEKASTDRRRSVIAAIVEKVILHPSGRGVRRVWPKPDGDGWEVDPSKIEILWRP